MDEDILKCTYCEEEIPQGASKYFDTFHGKLYCSEKCLRLDALNREKERVNSYQTINQELLTKTLANPRNLKPHEIVDTAPILGSPNAPISHPYKS